MKSLLKFSFLIILLIQGCNWDKCPVIPPFDNSIPFEINFNEYSENNYFIDEIYADTSASFNIYNRFYGGTIQQIVPKYYVNNIEVYISINQSSQVSNSITANAYVNLPPRSGSALYTDSFRDSLLINDENQTAARFRQLIKGTDYIFHPETGFITFLLPVGKHDVIAAAYNIENENPLDIDDLFYGEFMAELVNNSKSRAILKLIKPSNLIPQFEDAWELRLKNRYKITPKPYKIEIIELDIYLILPDGSEINSIEQSRFREIFGLDKFSASGNTYPDNVFDNITGYNFEPETMEIIFPVLQPFGYNIPDILKGYRCLAIYETSQENIPLPDYRFIIRGRYKYADE